MYVNSFKSDRTKVLIYGKKIKNNKQFKCSSIRIWLIELHVMQSLELVCNKVLLMKQKITKNM